MTSSDAARAFAIPVSATACNFARVSIPEPLSAVAVIALSTAERFDAVTPSIPMSASSAGVRGGEAAPPAATAESRATILAST